MAENFRRDGIKYGISVGRRQPMHMGHLYCIKDIVKAGLIPVIFIGSANDSANKYYNPAKNPLNIKQQYEQLKIVLEKEKISDYHIIPIADIGDMDKWTTKVIELLDEKIGQGVHKKAVIHYIAKKSDADNLRGDIKSLTAYSDIFAQKSLKTWQSYNVDSNLDNLNSTNYRYMDVSGAEFLALPAGKFIADIAQKARENNKISGIAVTMADIALERYCSDMGVDAATILSDMDGKLSVEGIYKALS